MKRNDKILIGTLLGIAVVLFLAMFFIKQNTVNGEAVVLIEGVEYGRYPLSKDCDSKWYGANDLSGLSGQNLHGFWRDSL